MLLKHGDKIGIVGCSNGQPLSNKPKIDGLLEGIMEVGLIPVCSDYIFERYSVFSGKPRERADALLHFFTNAEIKAIFDISGGDAANDLLEYIDFEMIKRNPKPFFGYSDLTTILNAIYAKTNVNSYLYQIRNLIDENRENQVSWFKNSLFNGGKELFDIKYTFIQGNKLEGVVVGGNIRCLLKLAGTPYMPDFKDKTLFLEAFGGDAPLISAFFRQLKQMGVFNKINGILLGTFTKMEETHQKPRVDEILINVLDDLSLPIAITKEVGHGADSKCIIIGKPL